MISAGAAFSKVDGTDWTCEQTIFDTQAISGDAVALFNIESWDLDSFKFAGYVGDVPQGWSWTRIDTEDTWEKISSVVQSFDLAKGDQTFINRKNLQAFTVSGAVEDTSKPATWVLPAGVQTGGIMNPFPVDTTLADLEAFAVSGDTVYVFNPVFYDFEYYKFIGKEEGWSATLYDPEAWEKAPAITITDTSLVVLPAGIGGYYQSVKTVPAGGGKAVYEGRTWEVSLQK